MQIAADFVSAEQPSNAQKIMIEAAAVDGACVQPVQIQHNVAIVDIHEDDRRIGCAKAKRAPIAPEAAAQDRAAVNVLEMVHEPPVLARNFLVGAENFFHVPQTRCLVRRANTQHASHRTDV